MKVFRYSLTIPLNTAFKSSFDLVQAGEINSKQALFEEIVTAVKQVPGIRWEMHDFFDTLVEESHPPKKEAKKKA